MVDSPFDVLGSAEHLGAPFAEGDEPPQCRAVDRGAVVVLGLDDRRPRVEDVTRAVGLPAHEWTRLSGHCRDDATVGSPGHRVDPEGDAAEHRGQEGLDEHGDRMILGAGPRSGRENRGDRTFELGEAVGTDDRFELSRHR